MADLHITLFSAAFAAFINMWLAARCGKMRGQEKIVHGDGGSSPLIRRMRAQANFVEYTPFALILIAALELSGQGGWTLAITALAFMIGRIVHAIGMDGEAVTKLRMAGMVLTLPILLGLAIAAILTAIGVI